ncbi:hypothetical protein K438DRAFT_1787522 [Mycena galopus ATCC 62051]|nr:hypothetical protein K438DRAFT_1787522 [Mycena galopus ATCC 62051]
MFWMKTVTLNNPPGILKQNLRLPFSRKIAVQKRNVHRWRQLIRLHKATAVAKLRSTKSGGNKSKTIEIAVGNTSYLAMSPDNRVEEILHKMKRAHLLPGPSSRIKRNILFPSRRYAPLDLDDTLGDCGLPQRLRSSNALFAQLIDQSHRGTFTIMNRQISINEICCNTMILGVHRAPKLVLLPQPSSRSMQRTSFDEDTSGVDWDSDMLNFNTQMQPAPEILAARQLAKNLHTYLKEEGAIDPDSDDDLEERSKASASDSSDLEDGPYVPPARRNRKVDLERDSEWFPWPDKQTCVLDILRHVPRCSLSKKQNAAIHWAMLALGLNDLPSDRVMDDIDKALQNMCGIQSIRYWATFTM